VLGVHLGEALRTGVVLEELVPHGLGDPPRAGAVQSLHLVSVGLVGVEASELTAGVAEQEQEVCGLRPRDLLHHPQLVVLVDSPGEHTELHGVQHYRPVGLHRRLLVQTRPVEVHGGGGGGDVGGAVVEGGVGAASGQAGRQRARLRATGWGSVPPQTAVAGLAVQQTLVVGRPSVGEGVGGASGACRAGQRVRGAPAALRGSGSAGGLHAVWSQARLQHGAGAGSGAGLGAEAYGGGAGVGLLLLLLVQHVPGGRLVVPTLLLGLVNSLLDLMFLEDHLSSLAVLLLLLGLPLLLLLLLAPLTLRRLLFHPPLLLLLLLPP